jgi:hypothetical protein
MKYNYIWKIFNNDGLLQDMIFFEVPEHVNVDDLEDELEYYISIGDKDIDWIIGKAERALDVKVTQGYSMKW